VSAKVYRKLSIKYHPDKNPDEESKRPKMPRSWCVYLLDPMTFLQVRSRQQQLMNRQEICGSSGCVRGVELRSWASDGLLIFLKRQKRPKHTRMMGIMGQTYPGWWFPRMTYQFLHGIIAHLTIRKLARLLSASTFYVSFQFAASRG
jgi:hypothetical protein